MLEVKGLRFAYEERLFEYDLCVSRGECLALLGPSGAGKSSLLNLLAGFESPLGGEVYFDGCDLLSMSVEDRPISMIFQDHNLFSHLSIWQNVAIGVRSSRLSLVRGLAVSALEQVGLVGFEDRFVGELSGGERRRVALARAIIRDRPLLLLDEPFTALHPALRYRMLDLLDGLRLEHGLTVILVTHLPDEARRIAGSVAFMDGGRVVVSGDSSEVLDSPGCAELAAYLGMV